MDSTEIDSGIAQFNFLVKCLVVKNTQKNREAAMLLRQLGRLGMEALIDEAIKPGRQPDHRIAILNVVAGIGEPLGPTEFFKLQMLLRHKVPRVAAKAAEVFMVLSPCGRPESPEAAALMRTFHPAFWIPPKRPRRPSPLRLFKAHCQRRARGGC